MMGTIKKYVFKIMAIYALLLCFTSFGTFADATQSEETEKPRADLLANKVSFSGDSFVVEWKVDQKSLSVHFKLNVVVDDKGWVLLGFMPVPKNNSENAIQEPKPMSIQDTKLGDFVLTWVSSASQRTTLDLNTNKTGDLQIDDNSTRVDYQVTAENSTENSSAQVLQITRKLDTGDPQDVPITDQPLWMFAAYGNSNVYLNLSSIKENIDDTLKVKTVIIVGKHDKTDDNNKPWQKIQEQVKKHWIGVVVGVAGLLTVVIVAMAYICSRKGKADKAKKIKMTFYKDDEDDEARVAFLHSRT